GAVSGTSTFCTTVSQGNSAKLWNTMATFGVTSATGFPCQSTSPADGFASPVSMRNSVDLPDPEGPSRARIMPDSMARLVGAITWIDAPYGRWKRFSTWRASMIGSTVGSVG